MKKSIVFSLLSIGVYLSLTSYKSGYGANLTGSHGSSIGCGSCHGSAKSTVAISIELDSAGVPVTSYKAGMTYTIKLTGTNNTTATNLAGYGGQLSIVSGTGASSVNAGTLSAPSSGFTVRTGTGSINYIEHTNRVSPTTGSGGAGTTYTVSATWVAPAAGTGTVKAFGIINAVNCNNNDGSGDYWNSGNASFTELSSSTAVGNVAINQAKMYPNPVINSLNIEGYNGAYIIYSIDGKIITKGITNGKSELNTANWAQGTYIVNVNGNISQTIIKQ